VDWGLALLGGGFVLLWIVLRAVFRWIDVREHLRIWGPEPYGGADNNLVRRDADYARIPK
jgi:hypothetical protein